MPLSLLILALSAFAIGTTEFVIMGLLPDVAADLGVSIPGAGWLVTGYALGVAIGAPFMALATARLPRKAALVALMGIFIIGNLLCALASDYNVLMFARVVTALCHGAFFGIGSVVANYDVDRHEDADKANQALKDAVAELMENEEIRGLIIGEPNFAGIVGLSNTAFTLRVSFTTLPLKQWTVRFALDSQVKKHFDLAGVRAPVQTYQVLPAPGATPAEPLPPGEPTL